MLQGKDIFWAKLKAARYSFLLWLVFALGTGVLSYVLFPSFHFMADGGWQGWRIVAAVDFVMGPLLFVVVYAPNKARRLLVMDMTILISIQFTVMGWGLYKVFQQHPVADNYGYGFFQSATASSYRAAGWDVRRLSTLSPEHPPIIYVRVPKPQEIKHTLALILQQGIPASAQWNLLESIQAQDSPLQNIKNQMSLRHWLGSSGNMVWLDWLKQHPEDRPENHKYAFFMGRYHRALLIFSLTDKFQGYELIRRDVYSGYEGIKK
ncbi:MAG: hypothetical protein HKM02_05440 [Pseudomonadales bacterium]|nr:hypothetical protein [Pseudomonadales bacterium]